MSLTAEEDAELKTSIFPDRARRDFLEAGCAENPYQEKGTGREDAELKNSIFPNRARRDFLEAGRAENASQEEGCGEGRCGT